MTPRTPLLSAEYVAENAPAEMVRLAMEWHGGQSSALYSLGSTGAVWSWGHLGRLSREFYSASREASQQSTTRAVTEAADLARCEGWCDAILAANPYAPGGILAATLPDTGGYNLLAVTDDGDMICERCATDPANPVHPDDGSNDGWGIVGWEADGNTESEEDYPCAHCGRVILEGYGADA